MQRLSNAACCAVSMRTQPPGAGPGPKTVEAVTVAVLMGCVPEVPTGYRDDYFECDDLGQAIPMLERRCIELVLGSSRLDAELAEGLAADLTAHAVRIGNDYMAPNFEQDGFVCPASTLPFIEQWRENFTCNLKRDAARPKG